MSILLLRYAQILEGTLNYILLDGDLKGGNEDVVGAVRAQDLASQARLKALEQKCEAQAQALREANEEIVSIKVEGNAARQQPRAQRAARKKGKNP